MQRPRQICPYVQFKRHEAPFLTYWEWRGQVWKVCNVMHPAFITHCWVMYGDKRWWAMHWWIRHLVQCA